MYTNMMTDWQDFALRFASAGRNPWTPVTGQWRDWTGGYATAQNANEMLRQTATLPLNFASIALERAQMMNTGQAWCLQWARNATEAYLTWIDVQEQGWNWWFAAAAHGTGKTERAPRASKQSGGRIAQRPQGELGLAEAPRPGSTRPVSSRDDLKLISGIGPGLEKKLNAEGIHTFQQIAALKKSDIKRLENNVIKFPGRIQRDKWVQQAKKLS